MSDTDLNKRVDDLTVILEINRQLGGAATDLNRLLALIVAGACRIFEAERGTIFLYDELNNVLVSKVATGQEELRVPADKGIVGAAAQSGETVNVPDAYADPRFNSKVDEETGFRTRNLLTLPLKDHEDKLVGVLQILNKRGGAFDADDEQVAAALSAQAGVALQRAMLIQEYLEKKRIERRLTTIREREAAKSRVMRVAAHQLRSPLAAAISLLRSMDAAYQKGPEAVTDLSARTEARCHQMLELVDDMLRLVEVREVSDWPPAEPADAHEAIRGTVVGFRELAAEKQLELSVDLMDGPTLVLASTRDLQDLLSNLISNAIKYTPPGGQVCVRASVDEIDLHVEVADTGIGIPVDEQERLFEEFFRAENAREITAHSSGLGLSICKEIITRIGGTIRCTSAADQGATFCFDLPLTDAE